VNRTSVSKPLPIQAERQPQRLAQPETRGAIYSIV